MADFLQPGPVDFTSLLNEPFLSGPEEVEDWSRSAEREAERKEQDKHDAYERRRRTAQETIRREREESEVSGDLSGDAQAFRDLRLLPRLTEIHQFEQKVRTPIVQGLLFKDTLAWIAGPSGTFKSFVTADLAFRYGAEDMDYHGRRMTSGRALLVIAEGSSGYADRRAAWEKQHDREIKNVTIYPDALQLADITKEMPALLAVLKEEDNAGRPFDLIVFDTQAMCTIGIDENTSEMNRVIRVLHRIRQASGACVLVVHHFGKNDNKGMRGSSMIYAAADTVVVVEKEKDFLGVTLSTGGEHGKQKDAVAEKDFLTLEMKSHVVGEDWFGDPLTSLAVARSGGQGQEEPDAAPVALPDITDIDLYYLRGIATYDEDGANPSALRERLSSPEYLEKIVRPPHKAASQTASNRLQGLKKKHLTEPVPGHKGRWRATVLGHSLLAQKVIERLQTEADWSDRHARRGRFRGPNTSGSQTLMNQGDEPSEPR